MDYFDFRAARSHCFRHILQLVPSLEVDLEGILLSVEQAVVLAARPHTIILSLSESSFEDGGTAFIEALEKRTSSFGTLKIYMDPRLTDENFKRLLQIEMIERLELPSLPDELAIFPFLSKVGSLSCWVYSGTLLSEEFQNLKIAPKKLTVVIDDDEQHFPADAAISCLRRIAGCGHLVELNIAFDCFHANEDEHEGGSIPGIVTQELVRAIRANANLRTLELFRSMNKVKWEPHIGSLLDCFEEHEGLREVKVVVDNEEEAFGDDFWRLQKLLSVNRRITVTNQEGKLISDGNHIDQLYAFNGFCRGSKELGVGAHPERSSVIMNALVDRAANDLQCTALLLSDHTDVLFEIVQPVENHGFESFVTSRSNGVS